MTTRQKLELMWIGKEHRPRLEPRILLGDTTLSHHAPRRTGTRDIFNNLLVYGDNLLALKALEQEFSGKVKCAYIDPPFNTGQAFEHYDDSVEHSTWLSLMRDRLAIIWRLLSTDGVLFVHIDMEEDHYLKVLLDEIFGRQGFLGEIAYERSGVSGIGQGGSFLVNTHEMILCYAKEKGAFRLADPKAATPLQLKEMRRYSKLFRSPGERTEVARFTAPSTGEPVVIYKHAEYGIDSISLKNAEKRMPQLHAFYAANLASIFRTTSVQEENEFQNRVLSYCGDGLYSADYLVSRGRREGETISAYYWNGGVFVWLADSAEVRDGKVVKTNKLSDFWPHADIPKADLANEGGVDFRRGKKPEALLARLLRLTTQEGDLVLDSFAGSGTTGAVAHKLRRRWIMVELGEHCHTHIIPRLKAVIDGTDPSGVTDVADWRGGGGFRYFRIAPSLLERDRWGNLVVNKQYNAAMLAEAMCKLEGFTYAPSDSVYWQQGSSTERDFIYVTTQKLGRDQLQSLSDDVGDNRSLLVCCSAFRAKAGAFPNLTIKKIPNAVLARCEWGHDDYSLQIKNLPAAPELAPEGDLTPEQRSRKRRPAPASLPLFDSGDDR